MKTLAVSAIAFALTLCSSGIVAASSSGTSAVSQGSTQGNADSGLTLFYKPGETKAPIDVSVDGSFVTPIQPGETIDLLPSSLTLTVELTAPPPPGKAAARTLTWQTEIREGKRKHVVVQLTDTDISLVQQRRYAQARPIDKVFAFDGEDSSWVDVSPPPPNALRRNDKASQDGIQWVSPKSWPVRVLFISGHGLYEFNKQGTVIRMDATATVYARVDKAGAARQQTDLVERQCVSPGQRQHSRRRQGRQRTDIRPDKTRKDMPSPTYRGSV